MKKYLVLYYSKTGNSKFLAEQAADVLDCDIKEIIPAINNLLVLYLLSFLKVAIPIGIKEKDLAPYEEVIILGPIWGGLLISPLRKILKECVKASKVIHFAVSCETPEEEKNSKYGFAQVLKESKEMGGGLVKTTSAFSMALVKGDQPQHVLAEKVKITEANFKGTLRTRFDDFVARIHPMRTAKSNDIR